MSLKDLTDRQAVLCAVNEFDTLGRQKFLDKYGFGKALNYFLYMNNRYYDSKAIVGVAHGYQHPSLGNLKRHNFSGGEATVKRKLEELGFEVVHIP